MFAALLFLIALDEPCTEDLYRPCQFIAPAVPEGYEEADGAVAVTYSIGFRGFPYGVEAESDDEALAQAALDAARQWVFAPFRFERDGESVALELRDGVWMDPWAADQAGE